MVLMSARGGLANEGSRSIHGRSDRTIADARHQGTVETVEGAVWRVCASMWCYTLGSLNPL